MNEPLLPHGFYEGPVQELAARHLALIKAVFILLLISVPGWFACIFFSESCCTLTVEQTYVNPPGFVYGSQRTVEKQEIRPFNYDASMGKVIGYKLFRRDCGKTLFDVFYVTASFLLFALPLHGLCLLIFRFYRLAKLLYPHLGLYFTVMVLVPFVNVLVIVLLLRSALHQMRQMGLRVGVFGIDPARFG